jgi:hypothetical protein
MCCEAIFFAFIAVICPYYIHITAPSWLYFLYVTECQVSIAFHRQFFAASPAKNLGGRRIYSSTTSYGDMPKSCSCAAYNK